MDAVEDRSLIIILNKQGERSSKALSSCKPVLCASPAPQHQPRSTHGGASKQQKSKEAGGPARSDHIDMMLILALLVYMLKNYSGNSA